MRRFIILLAMRMLSESSGQKLPDVSLTFMRFVRDLINQSHLNETDRLNNQNGGKKLPGF